MSSPIAYTATVVLEKKEAKAFERAVLLCGEMSEVLTLSHGKAFEGCYKTSDPKQSQTDLLSIFQKAGISADICVQPTENRRKKLLICDMDSTLIGQECIDELADFAGVKARVSEITERAMRGDIDFDGALKERVSLLKDLPLTALQACFDTRITLNAGAKTLAQTMRANGAKTVIVSGGFTFFTARIAELAGFDDHQANILLSNGDHLAGTVGLPILGREAKLTALRDHVAPLGTVRDAIAIGDGANDLAMIEAAGLGIAYYAKPTVAKAAHCAIQVTDLTSALYFQGYSDTSFVH